MKQQNVQTFESSFILITSALKILPSFSKRYWQVCVVLYKFTGVTFDEVFFKRNNFFKFINRNRKVESVLEI